MTAQFTSRGRRRVRQVPFGFLLPAITAFVLLVVAPAVGGFVMSFTDYRGIEASSWVGLDNYAAIISDSRVIASLGNTLLLALLVVIGQNLLGLGLALALEKPFPGRDALRVLFLLPAILSPVIIGFLWQYIYSPNGALNVALEAIGLHAVTTAWLGNPATALAAVAFATVWQLTGYAMVIYVAGLQGVSEDVVAASAIDGANAWQRLVYVRLPLIGPAITINLALSVITGLRLFDQILAMTGGGPGYATETLSTVIYKEGFVYNNLSYSLALSIVLGVLVAGFAAFQVWFTRRGEVQT